MPYRVLLRSAVAFPALACALLVASPASAAPGGPLGTLLLGDYRCELPGDAEGAVGVPQPAEDFTVIHGSGYATPTGRGVYLMTGDRVEFTSGPLRGVVYSRTGRSYLRRLSADGSEAALRCVRAPNSGR
jgi:hypothetical protein